MVKVSSGGSEVWRHDPADAIGFYAVAVDSNGDVIAAGAISSVAPTDHDLIVLKISGQTGLELWRTVIAGVHVFDRFSSVAIDSAGDVFAGGELLQIRSEPQRARSHAAGDVVATGDIGNKFATAKFAGSTGSLLWRYDVPHLSGCWSTRVFAIRRMCTWSSARDLAGGLKSIAAGLARAVNRVFRRTGRVLADRYHGTS